MRRVFLLGLGVVLLCVGVACVGTTVDIADRTYTAQSVPAGQVDGDDEVTPVAELPSQTQRIATRLVAGDPYDAKRYQVSIAGVHAATISTDSTGVYLGLTPHAERLRSVRYLRQDDTHYRVTAQGGAAPANSIPMNLLSVVLLILGTISVGRGAGFLDSPETVVE